MTKKIQTIIILLFLASCSDKNVQKKEVLTFSFADTAIVFKNNNQNVKLWFDSLGNIELISLLSDTNPEHIFLTESGKINQIQTTKQDNIELMYDFYSDGQMKKIKWNDLNAPFVNNQIIKFAKSKSKSLMINDNFTNVPVLSGLRDTFEINVDQQLTFKDIFGPGPTKYQIDSLMFQSPGLDAKVLEDLLFITVRAQEKGNYRLVTKVRTILLPKTGQKDWMPNGTYFKVDLDLIFN